jgi:hypothetical protein
MFGRLESVLKSEVKATWGGMMIAIPEKLWTTFEPRNDVELSQTLLQMAKQVNPAKLRKHSRGPKKQKVKKGYVSAKEAQRHVSTARVLRGDESTWQPQSGLSLDVGPLLARQGGVIGEVQHVVLGLVVLSEHEAALAQLAHLHARAAPLPC